MEAKMKLGDEWMKIFSLINGCIGKKGSEDLESRLKRNKIKQTKTSCNF